jgi:hypothetical protein
MSADLTLRAASRLSGARKISERSVCLHRLRYLNQSTPVLAAGTARIVTINISQHRPVLPGSSNSLIGDVHRPRRSKEQIGRAKEGDESNRYSEGLVRATVVQESIQDKAFYGERKTVLDLKQCACERKFNYLHAYL